jgi:hypothetical protein
MLKLVQPETSGRARTRATAGVGAQQRRMHPKPNRRRSTCDRCSSALPIGWTFRPSQTEGPRPEVRCVLRYRRHEQGFTRPAVIPLDVDFAIRAEAASRLWRLVAGQQRACAPDRRPYSNITAVVSFREANDYLRCGDSLAGPAVSISNAEHHTAQADLLGESHRNASGGTATRRPNFSGQYLTPPN